MTADHADAPFPLAIERLMLTDFRCYEHAVMETAGKTVVLSGPNGAGKTNILEAVSLLSPGRGLRRAKLSEIARQGGGGGGEHRAWAVAARAASPTGPVDLGTGLAQAGAEKRTVRIEGENAKSQAALGDYMDTQWLTPQMDRLFLDGKSARRRFLDRLVFGYDPAHAGRITAYEHAMRERARLLRDHSRDATWLTGLEDTMVTKGIAVAAARLDLVDRLGRYCRAAHGPFPGAGLEIDGTVEHWLRQHPALTAEDQYRASLLSSRESDGHTGGARVGPHKSDLHVRHLSKDQEAEICSTGEQKALLISIILADARMTAAERGRVPVLLLDEVAAHLDEERRDALFVDLIALGGQAWLTGTDDSLFSRLRGHAQFYAVADATVTPVSEPD
ncbi:MAG: DNA replication/repair protein RecF [Rhodospirillales bacterium]|jgi:DNA replication and repair protein RecF|nr:DNA replication/repair protein RecF [Rhodospirillales bacterium]MBT4040127.1 DNA replication/repair protein RecF [Rhodospirillales bacterium]MBT4625459.1 DNA replication/repair protein RecF [Rhodospirillales bacterium]MBT5352097.1 DNA replication/repair protein RecF [Rhodospirillales bacterium]MBT5521866.1 DNA replication/repair protein RecF [Rhodospirillales bacterium]